MNLISQNTPFCFNYAAFDQATTLNVAANIYDVSTGTAVFVNQIPMPHIANGLYSGNYTVSSNKTLLIVTAVFTDDTYTTLLTSRAAGAEVYLPLTSSATAEVFNWVDAFQSNALNVAANIYNLSTGSPVFVEKMHLTALNFAGVYYGTYQGVIGQTYQIESLVFTDNTYSTVNTAYAPGVDSYSAIPMGNIVVIGIDSILTLNTPFCFNYVAFDLASDLNVQASVYDITTGSPVLLTKVAMPFIANGMYSGNYTLNESKTLLIVSAVYTDSSFTTLLTTRAAGAQCYQVLPNDATMFAFNWVDEFQSNSLFVAANIYNMSSGEPVFVEQIPMTPSNFAGAYFGLYQGVLGNTYEIEAVVYTTNMYDVVDTNYAPGADNFLGFSFINISVMGAGGAILSPRNSITPPLGVVQFTQGDTATLSLIASDSQGLPVDLTGATLSTYIKGPNNSPMVVIPNVQHTINPNQVANPGQFVVSMTSSQTDNCGLGSGKEIITQVIVGSSTIYYHGVGILSVFAPIPLQ